MKQKAQAIRRTTGINDLFDHLKWIMGETERIVGARTPTFEEIRKMADYLRDIRVLLNELNCRDAWPGKAGSAGPVVTDLAARYLDLEGQAKEFRNDLDKGGMNGNVRRAV